MKRFAVAIIGVVLMAMMTACGNRDYFDTNYTYTKAIIKLQNGEVIEGEVQNWRDYSDGDQIQVTIDGDVYLVHSSNVTLINK